MPHKRDISQIARGGSKARKGGAEKSGEKKSMEWMTTERDGERYRLAS